MTSEGHELSRRGFIRLSAAGAVASAFGATLLNACAPGQSSSTVAGGGSSRGSGAAGALPTYIPLANLPKADYPSEDPRVVNGYEHLPKPTFTSWNREPPGAGGNIDAFNVAYYPPPTPYDQNPTWQEINRRLNANLQMNVVSSSDYRLRIGTLMAGDDLPDMIHIYFGIGQVPNLPDFFKAKCADLTPYLSGDAIRDYPNLAAIPTYAWQKSHSVIDGRVYQWPIHRYLPGLNYFFKNNEIYDAVIGADYVPRDAEDFMKVLQQLNRPQQNQWAVGNGAASPGNFGLAGYGMMFGAPYMWGKDASGKLVRDRETEEYKAAVGFVRDLWANGLMWPDAPTSTGARTEFVGGRFAVSVEGWGNSFNDFWRRGLQQNPPRHFDIIRPFHAVAGQRPQSYITGGFVSSNVLKKASPERIQELLRIADYLASPFGSEEANLLAYGVEGQDYTLDANGNPELTEAGVARAGYVPWRYLAAHPYVHYQPDLPGYAKRSTELEPMLVAEGVEDVTLGYYSKTNYSAQGNSADTVFRDGMVDIIMGRRPFSDYDGLVQAWRSSVGDQIRNEFMEAMAAA